jgi:hypothetical protein
VEVCPSAGGARAHNALVFALRRTALHVSATDLDLSVSPEQNLSPPVIL